MSERVEPALTPEEWEALKAPFAGDIYLSNIAYYVYGDGCALGDARYPKIAALANAARADDDPGKLTRADVAFLERFAASFRSMMDTHAFEFEALAAKIAALLPKEGT